MNQNGAHQLCVPQVKVHTKQGDCSIYIKLYKTLFQVFVRFLIDIKIKQKNIFLYKKTIFTKLIINLHAPFRWPLPIAAV